MKSFIQTEVKIWYHRRLLKIATLHNGFYFHLKVENLLDSQDEYSQSEIDQRLQDHNCEINKTL